MTDKYARWLAMIAARDHTLALLAIIAIGLVAAWELLRVMPPFFAVRLRPLYLIGGLAVLWGSAIAVYIITRGQT